MKVVVIALGTRGDVQPMIAFGQGLASAGYDVRVATHEPFRHLVTGVGLDFAPCQLDMRAFLGEGEGQAWLESGQNPLRAILQFHRAITPHLPALFAELRAATVDADVVVGMAAGILESTMADAAGAKFVRASIMPLTKTRVFPNVTAFPFARLPGPINALTHTVADQVVWHLFRGELQTFRRSVGLAPIPWRGPYHRLMRERSLVLNAYSPRVVPHPADWPDWVHTTGYWRLDDPHDSSDRTAIQAFLDAGSPPVYVGFGSMTPSNASNLTETVVGALRQVGVRGILMTGWGGLTSASDQVAGDLLVVDRVSHPWLLPQTLAAVHHGGAGTTGAAISAGVPSVVVPFFADQRYWGGRVARLGLGPEPMHYTKLTVDKLAAAISFAISDPVRARAASLGRDVAAERGVAEAVELFNRYVS
jgi:sterol 3beta-glucosyltransferase